MTWQPDCGTIYNVSAVDVTLIASGSYIIRNNAGTQIFTIFESDGRGWFANKFGVGMHPSNTEKLQISGDVKQNEGRSYAGIRLAAGSTSTMTMPSWVSSRVLETSGNVYIKGDLMFEGNFYGVDPNDPEDRVSIDWIRIANIPNQSVSNTSEPTFSSVKLTGNNGLQLEDASNSFYMKTKNTSTFTANRTLSINANDGDRILSLLGDLTVEANSLINQDVTTDATPAFDSLKLTGGSELYSLKINLGETLAADRILTLKVSNGDRLLRMWDDLWVTGDSQINQNVSTTGDPIFSSINVQGELRCDSFRIDQPPTTGTIVPDKYITIKCQGVPYKIAVKN